MRSQEPLGALALMEHHQERPTQLKICCGQHSLKRPVIDYVQRNATTPIDARPASLPLRPCPGPPRPEKWIAIIAH